MLFVAQLWGHKRTLENHSNTILVSKKLKRPFKVPKYIVCNLVPLNIDEKDKGSNFEINIRIND